MKQIIFLSFIMILCFDLQIDAMFQSDKIKQVVIIAMRTKILYYRPISPLAASGVCSK